MRFIIAGLLILLMVVSCNQKTNDIVKTKQGNDLVNETSPYLLQHAYNPVNWKPWGDTALKLAEEKNKLLIISIGYASCHWCHVMEEESFEDDSIAKLMNDNYISIKVDREERPDIDQIYMDAIQLMTGSGGWPLNVIALPNGQPVYAGTYHPKMQWKQILVKMMELYEKQPQDLIDYAEKLTQGIHSYNLVEVNSAPALFKKSMLDEAVNQQKEQWDIDKGGSKQAPKFPLPNRLEFLLRYGYQTNNKEVTNYVLTTLDQMAYGGIYDQIGGGFSRYSTDRKWHIPHFEKMLYDNAQLVSLYSNAYSLTKNELYKSTVLETLEFVERELMNEEGAFYSSLDADSYTHNDELKEGAFYVWTKDQLQSVLKEDFDLFKEYYNVDNYGSWEDGNFVLIRNSTKDEFVSKHNIKPAELEHKLQGWKVLVLNERSKRKRPRLDDKSLTSWNALMLKGYIDAYKAFGNDHFLNIALKNAEFLINQQLKNDGGLYHNYKRGQSTINGYLEDYASVIDAFISLYAVTADEKWLESASNLTTYTFEHFFEATNGLFYFTSDQDTELITRKTETLDNVIPSSNSMMARNLFKLSHYYSNNTYRDIAERMLNNIRPQMPQSPSAFSNWYLLMADFIGPYYEIAISGNEALEMLKEVNTKYLPNAMMAVSDKDSDLPLMQNRYNEDRTFIYVCVDGTCRLPVTEVKKALKLIKVEFE